MTLINAFTRNCIAPIADFTPTKSTRRRNKKACLMEDNLQNPKSFVTKTNLIGDKTKDC